MADSKLPATGRPPLITPPIPNIDAPFENEKVFHYKQRILAAQINKGSRYPPFNVQPMQWERMRVANPMTEADRFLRRQWWLDQKIGPGEHVYVPEADFKCGLRRAWSYPMDALATGLASVTGANAATAFRMMAPKFLLAYVLGIGAYYHLTYSAKSWENDYGVAISCSSTMGGSSVPLEPRFADYKFQERKFDTLPTSST